jgi:ADP-heptose:LPS heptosyltransferase
MYSIVVSEDTIIQNPGTGFIYNIKKDREYLINESISVSLKTMYQPKIKSLEKIHSLNQIQKPLIEAKSLLIYRPGGIGDILFILPYLSAIKRVNPSIEITFCTMNHNLPILDISDCIDHKITDPIELCELSKYDRIIFFEDFIENNLDAEITNAYDIAESFFDGIKRDVLYSNLPVKQNRNTKFHIVIQFSSGSIIRNIHPNLWWEIGVRLDPDKYELTILGTKSDEKDIRETGVMINRYSPNLLINPYLSNDLNQTMNYLLQIKPPHILIGPDSGILHFAGYHGIPVIGLFGPFPSVLRMEYYERAIGIDSQTNCPYSKNENGNCFQHGFMPCNLAQLTKTQLSPCLEKINALHVMKAVDFMIDKYYKINMGLKLVDLNPA